MTVFACGQIGEWVQPRVCTSSVIYMYRILCAHSKRLAMHTSLAQSECASMDTTTGMCILANEVIMTGLCSVTLPLRSNALV